MKVAEREEARRLRREEGLSVRQIEKVLGVSRASVSSWVRDIELTDEQIARLAVRSGAHVLAGSKAIRESALEIRKSWQEDGRRMVKTIADPLFVAGCMLYWGEGAKNRNVCALGNSDRYVLLLFMKFLKAFFDVKVENVSIRVQAYSDLDIHTVEEYWLECLKLPRSCLRKTSIDIRPRSSKWNGRARKLNYGVCCLTICSTEIVQKIFGAIKEIGGIEEDVWLS